MNKKQESKSWKHIVGGSVKKSKDVRKKLEKCTV